MACINSHNLLYHAFGIRSRYNYIRNNYSGGKVFFKIKTAKV